MNKLAQMRRGVNKLIEADKDVGTITRIVKEAGARGQLVPTGEEVKSQTFCRVGYESGGVWASKQWEGGLTIDTSPYVLAYYDADIKQGDVLEWKGKKYTVGVVSHPEFDGGVVCNQAPLIEVK